MRRVSTHWRTPARLRWREEFLWLLCISFVGYTVCFIISHGEEANAIAPANLRPT